MLSFRKMSRGQGLEVLKSTGIRAVAAVLALHAIWGPAQAQLGTPGGLEDILEQLQGLRQEAPEIGAVPGGRDILSPHDAARREAGAGRPMGLDQGTLSAGRFSVPPGVSPRERLLIEKFCRRTLSENEASVFVLIEEFSPLERDYCLRAGTPLFQFGYDALNAPGTSPGLGFGAIQDNYVLGVGDELVVTLHGGRAQTIETRVDREGRLILQGLAPISAAGRPLGDVRREIEALVSRAFVGTDVYVSVGSLRLLSIAIVGEVHRAGIHQLTGLSTVLDALALAGGVKKTGSLRRIHVIRGDEIFWVDLYDLLYTGGVAHDLTVFGGDRIVVPAVGSTVAIGGQAKRPGIYELPEGRTSVPVSQALAFAGGPLRPKGNRLFRITFDDRGRQQVVEGDARNGAASDGDIVIVNRAEDVQVGSVALIGHVRVPGRRSLASAPTLQALLGSVQNLADDPYMPFGVLQTTDQGTRARRFFPVNLQEIVEGHQDYALRDGDRLIVLSADDIRYLVSDDVQRIVQLGHAIQTDEEFGASTPKPVPEREREGETSKPTPESEVQALLSRFDIGIEPSEEGAREDEKDEEDRDQVNRTAFPCRGLQSLASVVSTTRSGRFARALRGARVAHGLPMVNPLPCPRVYDLYPNLLPFVLEHVVSVDGEVRLPGVYPIARQTSLQSLVSVAGGLTREADLTQVEVTQFAANSLDGSGAVERRIFDVGQTGFASVSASPGYVVRFNRVFTDRDDGPVLLSGEFVRPGVYDIRRGERLSEVIARAGGTTPQSYPYGAVFTRERVKRARQMGFRRAQRELRAAAAFAAAKRGVDPRAVVFLEELTREVGEIEAVGRVVIEADPTVLQVRPELDIVLEPGDRLFMPKRPNSVLVIGDVLNPGALQFISGTRADAYIRQAGGFQRSADQDRVFIVYPNGVAQPVSVNVWNYNPVHVPPGSTVVIPKNPAPLDIFSFSKDLAQLISQFAITAASLAVIGDK